MACSLSTKAIDWEELDPMKRARDYELPPRDSPGIRAKAVIDEVPVLAQVLNWLNPEEHSTSGTDTFDDDANTWAIKILMETFSKGTKLPSNLIMGILDASIAVNRVFPNVLQVSRSKLNESNYNGKLTIVGDTHGQYEDFAQIFGNASIGGYPSELNQFVFNGDIVDRGPKAVEILMVLLFAKLLSHNAVHIVHGNHETRLCTDRSQFDYGFEREVISKYNSEVYLKFHAFFSTLPVAAVVESKIFVVHGGLGAHVANATIEDINAQDRFDSAFEKNRMFDDMLWSDPMEGQGCRDGIRPTFGPDITRAFLERNKLDRLVRSHELMDKGHSTTHDGLCTTVFSAPNYCGHMGNLGAVLRYDQPDSMQPTVITFEAVPRPNIIRTY